MAPEPNNLTRVESYQYPAEHVGHLGPDHIQALERFKQLAQSKGYYTPAGTSGSDEPSHDDETLLRYLRARKWVPSEAFRQLKDTEDWRKENQLSKLYDSIDVKDYDEARRLYPQWTGRRDRRGIPVYVFEVANLNHKNVAAYESSTSKPGSLPAKVPAKMMRLFALYENLTGFALPLCSALPNRMYPETPVSQSSNIVDISNVGLKQFWNLKSHMQDASQLATAYYPETLDRIFIIGAPSFFPTVWGWIKRWFDPITVAKIFILSKANMLSTLQEFMELEDIPKKYGGKLDYQFGQLPNLDPMFDQNLRWINPHHENSRNTFPTGPIRLRKSDNGELVAVAVGSEGGKLREIPIAAMRAPQVDRSAPLGGGDTRRLELYRTATNATDTHPPTPPEGYADLESPPSETISPPPGVVPPPTDASRGATTTLPYRPAQETSPTPYQPAHEIPPISYRDDMTTTDISRPGPTSVSREPTYETSPAPYRAGTTSTRYEQQEHTLADGEVADSTPTLRDTGDGDKHGVIEPRTVGQAPKEHPMPEQPEEPQPSYLEQAYATAAGVAGAALKAVGLSKEGEKAEEEGEQTEERAVAEDPRVDNAQEKNVEEFLREQYKSKESKTSE